MFVPTCVYFRTAIQQQFFAGSIPGFLRVRWSQVLFLACVLVIPLSMAYYDGKAMLVCAETLSREPAHQAGLVCPSDGRSNWSVAEAGEHETRQGVVGARPFSIVSSTGVQANPPGSSVSPRAFIDGWLET